MLQFTDTQGNKRVGEVIQVKRTGGHAQAYREPDSIWIQQTDTDLLEGSMQTVNRTIRLKVTDEWINLTSHARIAQAVNASVSAPDMGGSEAVTNPGGHEQGRPDWFQQMQAQEGMDPDRDLDKQPGLRSHTLSAQVVGRRDVFNQMEDLGVTYANDDGRHYCEGAEGTPARFRTSRAEDRLNQLSEIDKDKYRFQEWRDLSSSLNKNRHNTRKSDASEWLPKLRVKSCEVPKSKEEKKYKRQKQTANPKRKPGWDSAGPLSKKKKLEAQRAKTHKHVCEKCGMDFSTVEDVTLHEQQCEGNEQGTDLEQKDISPRGTKQSKGEGHLHATMTAHPSPRAEPQQSQPKSQQESPPEERQGGLASRMAGQQTEGATPVTRPSGRQLARGLAGSPSPQHGCAMTGPKTRQASREAGPDGPKASRMAGQRPTNLNQKAGKPGIKRPRAREQDPQEEGECGRPSQQARIQMAPHGALESPQGNRMVKEAKGQKRQLHNGLEDKREDKSNPKARKQTPEDIPHGRDAEEGLPKDQG